MTPKELMLNHPIISEQIEQDELLVILEELQKILDIDTEGDVCEFGCFAGTTSLFLQRLLIKNKSNKKLYLYDSFNGLPEKSQVDQSTSGKEFVSGELLATKSQLKLNFKKANLPLPKIKKAWFKDLKQTDIPKKISFAFLDGDFYTSIKDSLNLIQNRIQKGGIIIVDDYDSPALPGAKLATDEFLKQNKNFRLLKITKSLALIQKS
ncbi:MAG: class I SAM-dependent methyltransferase [Candidatus Nomurabacteria bacterium]|nr:MAG: class I SAM-dependent methyltransferase [Candidatus Nomurabacteria bacterium]HRV75883.1 TylF/MycF/NovP-related O-methyltransferase [Candidatus Saccharimonadales bacterium]